MNEEEKKAFIKAVGRYVINKRDQEKKFILLLNLHDVISNSIAKTLRKSKKKCRASLIEVVKELPKTCSKDKFMEIISGDRKLSKRFESCFCKESTSKALLIPKTIDPTGSNDTYINNFYDQLKAKALEAGGLNWKGDFDRWTLQLSSRLCQTTVGCDKRRLADCLFVLLDLTAVLEKQHTADKSVLWESPVFQRMEGVLCETSNPSMSRMIFLSRKGTAFAQANRNEAMNYAALVLCDAAMFSRGKQIGSSIFAVVNIYIQHYSYLCQLGNTDLVNEALALKKQILYWINVGYSQFENECTEVQRTWKRVCLDKKIYCHLGIDILSRDICNAVITDDDIQEAERCLQEMDKLKDGMERLRNVHYFTAHGKLQRLKSNDHAACGFYKQALHFARQGNFDSEIHVLEQVCFHLSASFSNTEPPENRISLPIEPHNTDISSNREPVENDEGPVNPQPVIPQPVESMIREMTLTSAELDYEMKDENK